jgi:hypothetical protein
MLTAAPEKTRLSKTTKLQKELAEQLGRGEMPQVLAETLRLIPLDSGIAQRFQAVMQTAYNRLYSVVPDHKLRHLLTHDFKRQPVRIYLGHDKQPNAMYFKYSRPPAFMFTTGLLSHITCVEDLALVMCHEMVHLKLAEYYGDTKENSKVEEGLAYSLPLELLHVNGLNAEQALNFYENLLHKPPDILYGLIDEHPGKLTVKTITQDTLAYLRKQRGELAVPLSPLSLWNLDFSEAKDAQHVSWVDAKLEESDYAELSDLEKVGVCQKILAELDPPYSVRINDFAAVLSKLPMPDIGGDPVCTNLVDDILDAQLRNPAFAKLYAAVATAYQTGLARQPLGRLRQLAEAAKDFIVASKTESYPTVFQAAKRFYSLTRGEKLMKHRDGLRFLHGLDWPMFEFPDLDPYYRKKVRRKQKVEWRRLRVMAFKHPLIARAALALGLTEDSAFHAALSNDEHAIDAYQVNGDEVYIRAISKGPHEGSTTAGSLVIDTAGVVQKVDLSFTKETMMGKKRVLKVIARTLLSNFSADFDSACKGHDKATQRCFKTLNLLSVMFNEDRKQIPLLGLDQCCDNLDFFCNLNTMSLTVDLDLARQFTDQLGRLLTIDREKYAPLISEFFEKHNLPAGTAFHMQDLPAIGLLLRNPYVAFVLKDEYHLWPPQERLAVLNHVLHHELSFSLDDITYDQAKSVLEYLRTHLLEGELKLFNPEAGYEEVTEEIRKTKSAEDKPVIPQSNDNLKEILLWLRVYCLWAEKEPTWKQMMELVKASTPSILGSFHPINEMLRDRISLLASRSLRVGSGSVETVQLFKKLSDRGLWRSDIEYTHLQKLYEVVKTRPPVEAMLTGSRISDPHIRRGLFKRWATLIAGEYGQDDGTQQYYKHLTGVANTVSKAFSRADLPEAFDALAKAVLAQPELCVFLEELAHRISVKDWNQSPLAGMLAETTFILIRKRPEARVATLKYLMTPYSEASAREYINDAGTDIMSSIEMDEIKLADAPIEQKKQYEYKRKKVDVQVKLLYDNFWTASLEVRALMARELLLPCDAASEQVDEHTFGYVMSQLFPGQGTYDEEAKRWVRAYVDALPFYQRHLALAAMMVATERTRRRDGSTPLGQALAVLLENMGPGETKAGQGAESHPNVPEELRKDLGRLKYAADEPFRWDLLRRVDAIRDKIVSTIGNKLWVGDVLGSASLYTTLEIRAGGRRCALSLLRPHALDRAKSGFDTMRKMATHLGMGSSTADTLVELIEEASTRVEVETDTGLAQQQYQAGFDLYDGVQVGDFAMTAPRCLVSGPGFFLMDLMTGDHFSKLEGDRKPVARAILTRELRNIFYGTFDSDRHGGNVLVEGNFIRHLDFKGMALDVWKPEDYKQLASVLKEIISRFGQEIDLTKALFETQQELRRRGKNLSKLVLEVQKAVLSLGDYTRLFSSEELGHMVMETFFTTQDSPLSKTLMELT